ncbi:branched-chain amino acid transport system ATP-binding protein [Rhodoligotrophos appendicifer]|uniref:ABC transporter ATP-binding protein n=1 Tax=Rhodoligotrophos appendicifer TaxID=987056 RepID=UPI001185FA86|nr:ABC transporter ATP-binding protein [Rhodoligotrophos appendicifer]
MLTVEDLTISYGGVHAVRNASLEVRQGEMVALIGSNGAGKSSLLNGLSGIVRPRSGSVRMEGQTLSGQAAYRIARLGLIQVPEGRHVLGSQTVTENLLLGRLALGDRQPQQDLPQVFKLFPILKERAGQRAGSLSGGQQQMLAIGRALMGSPKVLLLDEPSLGLAPIIIAQVFEALRALNQAGLTILVVEQNARRALTVSKRAYILERGRIAYHGDSTDLLHDQRVTESYLGVIA